MVEGNIYEGDGMKLGKAVAIFCNIYNSQESNAEKMEAISIVVKNGMPFNSITKQEYVNALQWIFENYEVDDKEE